MYTPVLSEKLKFWTLSHHCHFQLASGPHTLDSTAPISGDRSFNTVCRKISQFSETTSVSIKITSRASFITSFHFFDYLSLVTHTVLTWSLYSATTEIVFEGLSKQQSKQWNWQLCCMNHGSKNDAECFPILSHLSSTSRELPNAICWSTEESLSAVYFTKAKRRCHKMKMKQARKARRCDSYLQIWNYQRLTDPLHWQG